MAEQARRKSFLFICRKSPYTTSYGNACLDLMLTTAAFEQDISVIFMEDGVYQLLKNQNSEEIGLKNISPAFPALDIYDIKKIMIEQSSLTIRGLSLDDLLFSVEAVDAVKVAQLMEDADQVFNF